MTDRIKFGSTLHIQFTEVNLEEEGLKRYIDRGELVIEPNPESADRFPGMVSSFIATFKDAQTEEQFQSKVIGFELRRSFLDLAGEAMVRLGFIKH